MSILSPYFHRQPPTCNFCLQLQEAGARMNDHELATWAQQLDWHEPIVLMERSQYPSERGQHTAYQQVSSPIEALLMTGNVRLVRVLLPIALASPAPKVDYPVARTSSSDDMPRLDRWINACIKSGSPETLACLLDVAPSKEGSFFIQGWTGSSHNRPLGCLASQLALGPEVAWEMWSVLRSKALADPPFSKKAVKEYERVLVDRLFDDSVSMGFALFAEKLAKNYQKTLGFEEWKTLIYEGQLDWALDFAARQTRPSDSLPLEVLVTGCVGQWKELSSSPNAKSSAFWREGIDHARMRLDRLMGEIEKNLEGTSWLSASRHELGDCMAPLVMECPEQAARFLNARQAPMGLAEAFAWLSLDPRTNGDILSSRFPTENLPHESTLSALQEWVDKAKVVPWPQVIAMSEKLGLAPDCFRAWRQSPSVRAHAEAALLDYVSTMAPTRPQRRL